ncbi:hypothetical protein AGMMS50256_17240 [Betaproteobacteria bacterium]|nr:hypothetical protein AGMMS50256_17240 [Betaproteobacteria bacterium]
MNASLPARSAWADTPLLMLAAALYFVTMQLALLIASANPFHTPRLRFLLIFLMFFQLGLAYLLARQRRTGDEAGLRRVFVPALALAIPCFIASHAAFAFGYWAQFSLLPALFGSLFLPLIWTAFAAATPPERQGICLAAAMTAGEFVWLVILPLLPNLYVDDAYGLEQLAHLHKIQALIQVALCGILIHLLLQRPHFFLLTPPPDDTASAAPPGEIRNVMPVLFLAGAVFFVFSGFALDTVFPKITQRPELWGDLPYFLLALFPATGLLLDFSYRGTAALPGMAVRIFDKRGLPVVAAFLALSLLAVALMIQIKGENLFLPFYLGRQIIMLLFWFILLRLAGHRPFFPLLAALVLGLDSMAYPGKWLAALTPPEARGMAALALTACFTALIAYLCWQLKGDALGSEDGRQKTEDRGPEDGEGEEEGKGAADDRSQLFAERGLTEKEKKVATLILLGLSVDEMAERLFLSKSTVNFHIRNILHKFDVANRRLFISLFIK